MLPVLDRPDPGGAALIARLRPSLDSLSELREGTITSHEDVLGWFDEKSSWTITALAREMALSRSTVRRYLNDLLVAGYLTSFGTHPVVYVKRMD